MSALVTGHPADPGALSGHAVVAKDLGKRYGRHTALEGVSFALAPGEMLAVVGPDGAGKTTLVQILAGLLVPSRGTASVAGIDTRRGGTGLAERVGYMSEGFTLYGSLTVAENLSFAADLFGVPARERARRMVDLLRFSRLESALYRRASQLSGGMQKKLALACVLIHEPRVLLLDEPTLGVDPLSRQEFWRLLERFLSEGMAIVVSTPYLDEAERCQQALLLHEGRPLALGTPADLRAAYAGTLWNLRTAVPDQARVVLTRHYGQGRAYLTRRDLRVAVPPGGEDLAGLLRTERIEVQAAHRVEPTLEDLFVSRMAATTDEAEEPFVGAPGPTPGNRISGGVRTHALTRRFGSFTAVDRVSLDVRPGEVFGLVGPNGSGKSTLIRMLTGLLPPSDGYAEVAGRNPASAGPEVRRHVGYMAQRFSLYLDLSVRENLRFFGGVYGLQGEQLEARTRQALDRAGLRGAEGARTGALGGGFRQRLALAVALLHEPAVVFLDEPTSGVDPLARRRFWDLMYAVAHAGTAVLVTTHYLDEAERCDRVAVLAAGRLVDTGTPDELKSRAMARLGGQLVTVPVAAPVRVRDRLARLPWVTQATVYGTTVRVVLRHDALPAMIERELGPAVLTGPILPVQPTLEDAFAALLAEAEATP